MEKNKLLQEIEEKSKEIIELKKKLENNSRFAEVQFADEEYILLEVKNNFPLVETWLYQKDLNDFDWFKEENEGHFWIQGNVKPFEIFLEDKWVYCNERTLVRFLNE